MQGLPGLQVHQGLVWRGGGEGHTVHSKQLGLLLAREQVEGGKGVPHRFLTISREEERVGVQSRHNLVRAQSRHKLQQAARKLCGFLLQNCFFVAPGCTWQVLHWKIWETKASTFLYKRSIEIMLLL